MNKKELSSRVAEVLRANKVRKPVSVKKQTFHITDEDLSYYNVMLHKWVVENGRYDIHICASSRDIRLTESLVYEDPSCYTMRKMQEDMIA